MHQRRETIQAKKQTLSINSHLSNSKRQRKTLRRTCANGLPSLAANTVKMVVATLEVGSTMPCIHENNDLINEQEHNDDDDDDDNDILNIGQNVKAHIPDIVLHNLNDLIDRKGNISIPNEHNYNNATLLFLDVSGFTSLTEQYSNAAHLGIDQLTRTLNSYFDKLVYEILAHEGDIYKFAGDAILSLWIDEHTGPQQALKCALHLQQKCGMYETDVGVILRVKVALAYGNVRALFVGTEEFKHYLLTGDGIKDVNICEQLCEPGDIIITQAVYKQFQSTTFDCQFVPVNEDIDPKHEHIAVKYTQSRHSSFTEESDAEEHINSTTMINERIDISNQELPINNNNNNNDNNQDPSCDDDLSIDDFISKRDCLMKSFLLRCVYQRIERKQSLYYLSELRRVTISFINLDTINDQDVNENLHENVHKIFLQIYELTKMMGGVLTKALLFDKGWSFLCVFGLPGYKQGDDTANALKSAQMIHSTIREQCKFVEKCSIGVTTGLTYCGVVGHKARCEYTVIGRKVNMAARLMCNYPSIISCDQETYYNSRLNSRFFQILPTKTLKGMNNIGAIWQYSDYPEVTPTTEQNKTLNDVRQEDYPLLGRRVELMIVAAQIMLLDEPTDKPNRRRDLAAIIFEGEDKIGRSRLLQFIAESIENSSNPSNLAAVSYYDNIYTPNEPITNRNNSILSTSPDERRNTTVSSLTNYGNDCSITKRSTVQVVNHRCQFEQRFNEFGLLRSLLRQLLQFHNNDKTQYEREQYLLRLFDINKGNDLYLRKNLFLLNDLLDVRFRRSHIEKDNANEQNLLKTYETNINELILHILNKIIESTNNIAESYAPLTLGPTLSKTSYISPVYLQSRASSASTSSLTSPAILTVSKIIFIIDDIHFADASSLKHLLTLGSHSKSLLILSMKPPRNNDRPNSVTLQSISTDSRVYLRRLPGLELRYLATLGCQILSVHRLPSKLVKVLNESCNGIPGFCEQILYDLLSKDKIHIVDSNTPHDQDSILVDGDPDKLLTKTRIKTGIFKTFFSRRKPTITSEQMQNERAFSRICLLRNRSENDFNADCQQNFQNYIMCRIDRLSDSESLLIKIAAVIGNTFSRIFLWHLVDQQSKKLININSCILEMMQRTIVECALSTQQITKTRSIKCYCLQNPGGFPSQCRLMAFTHSTIREGIYNSLTDSLKRLLTRNAIEYLERQCTIVCLTCGAHRTDCPFLVDEHDGLAKILKNRQQHAFVDIVQIAALKEIDNTIKESTRLAHSPTERRSTIASSKFLLGSMSVPNGHRNFQETDSPDSTPDIKRRNSLDNNDTEPPPLRRSSSAFPSTQNTDFNTEELSESKFSEALHRNSSDRNLTLISVYSPNTSSTIQVNVQRSKSTLSRRSQFISLFKVPKRSSLSGSISNKSLLPIIDESGTDKTSTIDKLSEKRKAEKTSRFVSFVRYLFCQLIPTGSNAIVTPAIMNAAIEDKQILPASPPTENEAPLKPTSHWKKVRQAVLPSRGRMLRKIPSEDELLEHSMFSSELMDKIFNDLNSLNKQISFYRTFEFLYEQSYVFHIFQSYTQHNTIIHDIYESKHIEPAEADLTQFVNEFIAYADLRICECPDYVMTVYMKLVEYHTNLYDIYEKTTEDKRDNGLLKQFDRIMYYRIEICQLLLRCSCLQRLLVEIENGKRFLEKYSQDTNNLKEYVYYYHHLIYKYTFDFFQATLLQHSRSIYDSKQLCQTCFNDLTKAYQDKIWEKLISNTEISASSSSSSAIEKRHKYESNNEASYKESSLDAGNHTPTHSDHLAIFDGKYRLEYLLCRYHLLQYNLSRSESINSINTLLELEYYTFPLSFSLPCTISLIDYFYSQMNTTQCLFLINKIINFWWIYTSPRERLEFAKLKCLSLIIELRQGSIDLAILSGYFAKRILTGYHENIFLIESCIHLTFALIGEMRLSNIESILQHLEYLSEQTMNCYAKLWYYILIIDVAIELGYELLPISIHLLDNIIKYRKKLHSNSTEQSLLLTYSDCIFSQIYARLGLLDQSKIYYNQVLHQIKYEKMYLSYVDFRFKRVILKLIEIQLIHWYYNINDDDDDDDIENQTKNDFLLNKFQHDDFISWNKTRFFIYQAYYDRLINDYRRKKNLSIDNDFNWKDSLSEGEKYAIKLDQEWIKRLRHVWLHPVEEQYVLQQRFSISPDPSGRSKHRRCVRSSVPEVKIYSDNELTVDRPNREHERLKENYSQQKFLDWRLFLNNNNLLQFQLYILPVRV